MNRGCKWLSLLGILLLAGVLTAGQPYNKMLVVGNSLTYHVEAPDLGWFGEWGMAATSQANDYVHLVHAALQGDQPTVDLALELGAVRGEGAMVVDPPDGTDPWTHLLPTDADLVIIQLGDNYWYTSNLQHLQDQFAAMVAAFKAQANNPEVFCISTWASNADKDAAMRAGAESSGARWISISGLINVAGNQAFDQYDDWGVGWHPSDQGMAAIADRVTTAIQDANPYYFAYHWTEQVAGGEILYGGNLLEGHMLTGQINGGVQQWATIPLNKIDDPCSALFAQYGNGATSAVVIGDFVFFTGDGDPAGEVGIGRMDRDGGNILPLMNPGNTNPQSLATDGEKLFTDNGVNLGYVHRYSFDPNDPNGFNPAQDWVAMTGAGDIKAISSYAGNIYAVDAVGGSVYEIDGATGVVSVLGTHVGVGGSQVVRFGDSIFIVGADGKLWTYPLENGVLGAGNSSDLSLGALYGLTMRGYKGQPVGYWVTSAGGNVSYYGDLQILGGVPGGRFSRSTVNGAYYTGYWSSFTSPDAAFITLQPDGGSPAPSNYAQLQVTWYPRAANLWYAHNYGYTPTDMAWVIKADLNSAPGRDGCDRIFALRAMPTPGTFTGTIVSLNVDYVNHWIDWVAGSRSGRVLMHTYPGVWKTATLRYDPTTGIASGTFGGAEVFSVVTETGLAGNAVYFSNLTNASTYDTGTFMVDNVRAMLADDPTGVGPVVEMVAPAIPADGYFTVAGGLESVQLLFSEPVGFDSERVIVTNANGENIAVILEGNSTRIMTIMFAEPMNNDSYTIRVKDTVAGLISLAGIDGDNDGQPGGDYVLTMHHRRRADADGDGNVDIVDLSALAADWLWTK